MTEVSIGMSAFLFIKIPGRSLISGNYIKATIIETIFTKTRGAIHELPLRHIKTKRRDYDKC